MRASGRVTRKCMHVMRVRAWVCARVRVRMREGGSGCVLAGDLWGEGMPGRRISQEIVRVEGMRRRWEDSAGLSASRRRARGNGRTQGKQGGGGSRASTLHIFSRVFFGTIWLITFPYSTFKSALDLFSGQFKKNFIISDISTFRDFAYIFAKLILSTPFVISSPPPPLSSPSRGFPSMSSTMMRR